MHAYLVDRISGLTLDTAAEWMLADSVSGTITLTGAVDLAPGEYDFAVRVHQGMQALGHLEGVHLQLIVGQVVDSQHCTGSFPA